MEVKEEVNVCFEWAAVRLRPTYQLGTLHSSFHSDALAVDTVCGVVMSVGWCTETEAMRETCETSSWEAPAGFWCYSQAAIVHAGHRCQHRAFWIASSPSRQPWVSAANPTLFPHCCTWVWWPEASQNVLKVWFRGINFQCCIIHYFSPWGLISCLSIYFTVDFYFSWILSGVPGNKD